MRMSSLDKAARGLCPDSKTGSHSSPWQNKLYLLVCVQCSGGMVAKKHVFISYSREDVELAKRVRKYLTKLDVPVWQDIRELRSGDDWEKRIMDALSNASALILVVTKAALTSTFVNFEWAFAKGAGAKFIPVLMETVRLPRPLSSTNYVDFTKPRKPWNSLADALNKPMLEEQTNAGGPRLLAEMSINEDGKPWYEEKDELAFRLLVAEAPVDAATVHYKLHHKSFRKSYRNKTRRNAHKEFRLWRQSYGDILVSATIVSPGRKTVIRDTLFNLLKKRHGTDRRQPVREALNQIRDN